MNENLTIEQKIVDYFDVGYFVFVCLVSGHWIVGLLLDSSSTGGNFVAGWFAGRFAGWHAG